MTVKSRSAATDPNGNTSEFSTCVTNTFTGPMSADYTWHYTYDALSRLTYACSAWDDGTSTCNGDEFVNEYDGAGNQTRLGRWDDATQAVVTVSYVYNGANRIQCIDTNSRGDCDLETLYSYDAYGKRPWKAPANEGVSYQFETPQTQ